MVILYLQMKSVRSHSSPWAGEKREKRKWMRFRKQCSSKFWRVSKTWPNRLQVWNYIVTQLFIKSHIQDLELKVLPGGFGLRTLQPEKKNLCWSAVRRAFYSKSPRSTINWKTGILYPSDVFETRFIWLWAKFNPAHLHFTIGNAK